MDAPSELVKVGFDYFPAVTHAPGRGRYARELVRALARHETEGVATHLFDIGRAKRIFHGPALGLDGATARLRRRTVRLPRRSIGLVNRLIGFGADGWIGGCDVWHHTSPQPLRVEHAQEILPVFELPPAGSKEDREFEKTLERIEYLLCFSDHYAREVCERYSWSEELVKTAPVGCDHWVRELEALPERDDPPMLLVLGALDEDRKPHLIRKAYELARTELEGLRLVYCGRPGNAAEQFVRDRRFSVARETTEWIEDPVEDDLPALVARASALVHLSRDEGSAVTPLEALRVGTPVVASRLPAFEEVFGDEGLWFEGKKPEDLAPLLVRAVESARDRAAVERRIELATPFTWERAARRTLEIWREVAANEATRRT